MNGPKFFPCMSNSITLYYKENSLHQFGSFFLTGEYFNLEDLPFKSDLQINHEIIYVGLLMFKSDWAISNNTFNFWKH